MKISQHMTYRCDTGIMLGCQSCTVFLRIYAHTAEFTDLKGLSTQCQTVLKIKHRTSVVCFYRNRYDQHDRWSDYNADPWDQNIHNSLCSTLVYCQSHISGYQKRCVKKMDAFTSHKNDVRNLRTHIASDRMCKTVFQITVSLCWMQIPDDHAVIILHHLMDFFFSHTDVYLAADVIFVLSGIHLMDQVVPRIPVTVNDQKPACAVKSGIDIPWTKYPDNDQHQLYSCHLDHRPYAQEPPVDQGDLQIFHHIGTQKCQCQRIKYINPLKISNLKSSVQFGKQGKHQTVDCDQYPVTFAPERLVDLSSVNGIPHPCKDRRLCQNHQTRQTKYDKSFIIFSFTHVITSVSL